LRKLDVKNYLLTEHKTDKPCKNLFNPIFVNPPTWAPQYSANPNPLLNKLAGLLSGDDKNNELVYLDQDLNNLKNKVG